MPNKRFLGLGFTFTATDKGLEKKLTSVSSLLSDISSELDTVNKKFKGFEALMKNAEMPQVGAMPTQKGRPKARKTVEQPRRKKSPVVRNQRKTLEIMPVEVTNFKDLGNVSFINPTPMQSVTPEAKTPHSGIFIDESLSQLKNIGTESQQFFGDIIKSLRVDMQGEFKKSISELELFKDEFGELTTDSKKKLRDLAISQSKQTTLFSMNFHKRLGQLDLAFTKTTEYLSDVKDSFGELAGTFGLHLKDIIPPQFMAAGKLLKTILGAPLKGLLKGAKSIVMKPFTKKRSAADTASTKNLRNINIYGKKQVVVAQQNGKTTKQLFTTSKKSEGILSTISSALAKSETVFAEMLDVSQKASAKLGGNSIGRGKKNIYNAIDALSRGQKTEGEGDGMSLFKKIMMGAAVLSLVIGIVIAKWDDIKAWFAKIGPVLKDAVGSIGTWAKEMGGKAIDWVSNAFSGIKDYVAKAFQGAIDSVAEYLKDLGPKIFSSVMNPFSSVEKKGTEIKDKLLDTVSSFFGGKKADTQTATPLSPMDKKPVLTGPMANRVEDLRNDMAMKQQTESSKNSDAQLMLMQQNNTLMNQMLTTLQKSPPGGNSGNVKVNISSDARKQGFALQKQELDNHGLAGQ